MIVINDLSWSPVIPYSRRALEVWHVVKGCSLITVCTFPQWAKSRLTSLPSLTRVCVCVCVCTCVYVCVCVCVCVCLYLQTLVHTQMQRDMHLRSNVGLMQCSMNQEETDRQTNGNRHGFHPLAVESSLYWIRGNQKVPVPVETSSFHMCALLFSSHPIINTWRNHSCTTSHVLKRNEATQSSSGPPGGLRGTPGGLQQDTWWSQRDTWWSSAGHLVVFRGPPGGLQRDTWWSS